MPFLARFDVLLAVGEFHGCVDVSLVQFVVYTDALVFLVLNAVEIPSPVLRNVALVSLVAFLAVLDADLVVPGVSSGPLAGFDALPLEAISSDV